ncbi:MAG: AbgT family transporter [Rubrobacter sp.]|nr:AbgT family transporter [Rubrobacter sp.]
MSEDGAARRGFLERFLDFVERAGNRLPHPFMIFVYLALITVLLSWIVSLFGVSFTDPASGDTLEIQSLVSGAGVEYILTSTVTNFVEFPPLGTVLIIILGIGVAQRVGLIEAVMKKTIMNAPPSLITYAVVLSGILGNLASDAAFIVIPPLAALVFLGVGRHPLAGLAAGFAAAGAGFSANFFITSTDALLSGISTSVVQSVAEDVVVTPVSNWFFMIASVPVLVIAGVFITERIVEPRLGAYDPEAGDGSEIETMEELSPAENRGLRNTLIATVVYVVLLAAAVFPSGSPFRNEDGGLVPSPLLDGVVPIIFVFFIAVALAYGVTVGEIETPADIPRLMGETIASMAGFIVLIFAAAQFLAYFEYSNLSTWIAVSGAGFLESINLTGLPILFGFIFVTAILSFVIYSGSALWAILAPIFIPLFFLLDYNPAYVQAAYRIADSSTNVLTPLNPYVPLVLAFIQQYDRRAGFGTLFSMMLPYTVVFLVLWTLLFAIWAILGLPVGPGEGLRVEG